jgi:hypothetical protein
MKRNTSTLSNHIAFAKLCQYLHESSYTKKELTEKLGVTPGTAGRWINLLHQMQLVYIAEWKYRDIRGGVAAMYEWGYKKKDVIKRTPPTGAEYAENYRKRKKEAKLLGVL